MITEVTFENFKSIRAIDNLRIKPLTIITGSNGSGKSTILEGIACFAEAARLKRQGMTPDENVPFQRVFTQGGFWKYPQEHLSDFIVHKRDEDSFVNLEIKMAIDKMSRDNLCAVFSKYDKKCPIIDSIRFGVKFRLKDGYFKQSISDDKGNPIAYVEKSNRHSTSVVHPYNDLEENSGADAELIFQERSYLPQKPEGSKLMVYRFASIVIYQLKKQFNKTYFISGERGRIDPEVNIVDRRNTPFGRNPPQWVGYRGENVVEILSRCFTRERRKASQIAKWAAEFQLSDITAGYGDGKLESNFVDNIYNTELNSSLAGLGSRQVLPIIVQIFDSESGSTILIEEPEVSLHPESQVKINQLFAEAVSQGKQIICTTHSPFLILALSRIIKKGLATTDDIAVYHAEKTAEGTIVNELKINKFGFLTDGVPSFMKIEQQLLNEWSESLEEE